MTSQQSLQREALRLVFKQLIATMMLSFIIFLMEGLKKGLSVFLGGFACVGPQLLFTWRLFSYARLGLLRQFMVAFFAGETFKLIFSAVLFILLIRYFSLNALFMIVGYLIAIVSFWMVCGWHFSHSFKARISS